MRCLLGPCGTTALLLVGEGLQSGEAAQVRKHQRQRKGRHMARSHQLRKLRSKEVDLHSPHVGVPKPALSRLASLIVPDAPSGGSAELVITIADKDVNVREFAAYLSLMDRIYGRVSPGSLRPYSLTSYMQLRITEIRKGSLELSILEVLSHLRDTFPFLTLWLFLKYFPIAFKSISESVKNLADAYKSLEEARIVKERRKQ